MTDKVTPIRLALEGLVIVGSILLAFAIDAAWDNYQGSQTRAVLLASLIDDFEVTQERLNSSIETAQSHHRNNTRFLKIISSGAPATRDELGALASSFVAWEGFEPALSTYDSAVGQDGLASIHSVGFSRAIAQFYQHKIFHDLHNEIFLEMYYQGSLHNIQRELGSFGVLLRSDDSCSAPSCIFPQELDLTTDQLRAMVLQPKIYAGFESTRIIQANLLASLEGMNEAVTDILIELKSMR
ncbi:MAG: hypothetical protein ABJ013_08145 [Halioglobus sp.]